MIKKYKIFLFYVITFIFTIILGGIAQVVLAPLSQTYQLIFFLLLIQMTPTLGTICISILLKDWSYWKKMNWNLFHRKNFLWLLISLIIPAIIILTAAITMSIFGTTYISPEYSIGIIILFILTSLVGCIGEEIGWRGFMQPSFNKRYSLIISAAFTGMLWGAWHIGKLTSYGFMGYLLFILFIIELSIIMVWIYSKSNANMINMVLFHLGVNVSALLLLTNREGIMFYLISCIISGVMIAIIIFINKRKTNSELLV